MRGVPSHISAAAGPTTLATQYWDRGCLLIRKTHPYRALQRAGLTGIAWYRGLSTKSDGVNAPGRGSACGTPIVCRGSTLRDMHRRWAGLLVVVVAFVAVVIAARSHARPVSGYASATSVPGAPRVGDCVLQPFAAGGGWADPGGVYPPLRTGTCTGLRYGEVVAVVSGGLTDFSAAAQTAADPSKGVQDTNPLFSTCTRKVGDYIGIVPTAGTVPALLQIWHPPGVPDTTVIGPSTRQRAAGQRWLACAYDFPADAPGSKSSLKDEFTSGQVPGVFAWCRTSADPAYPTYAPVACNIAHPVEEFGLLTAPAPAQQQEASCGQLVHQLTGMADPTDGGRLQIRVLVAPKVDDAADPIYCVVAAVGPHTLNGPLLGLGSGPVPWTS